MNALAVSEMESPIGTLLIVTAEEQLCAIEFGGLEHVREPLAHWSRRWFGLDRFVRDDKATAPVRKQLEQYFAGERRQFHLPLLLRGTPFQIRVWQALLEIPYGETRSYREVARMIGAEKAVRAVGGANNRNPLPIVVPCHRVIGADGSLVGYGGGLSIKRHLLQWEARHAQEQAGVGTDRRNAEMLPATGKGGTA
jgi:O-6-methylguanine DNA methyltransferase